MRTRPVFLKPSQLPGLLSPDSWTLGDFRAGPQGPHRAQHRGLFMAGSPVNEGSTNFPRCTDSSTSRAFAAMPFDFHLMWRGCTKLLWYYSAIFIWCDEDAHCALHKPFMILFSECPKQIIGKLPEKKSFCQNTGPLTEILKWKINMGACQWGDITSQYDYYLKIFTSKGLNLYFYSTTNMSRDILQFSKILQKTFISKFWCGQPRPISVAFLSSSKTMRKLKLSNFNFERIPEHSSFQP